jgi:hypothetical protein
MAVNPNPAGRISLSEASIATGAVSTNTSAPKAASFSSNEIDWRVRLSVPESFLSSPLMQDLKPAKALIFPFTPFIQITHTAHYNPLDTVHSNYQFLSYEQSRVDSINITADFYCEDAIGARYWVAAVHYLRSVTKMHYGETINAGSPPPVVKLSGYGDYVFNNVPVVVSSFNMELPKDVDYIPTKLAGQSGNATAGAGGAADKVSYAPVRSTFNIEVRPVYSREQVRKFSLDDFANGAYLFDKNKPTGFI